MELRASEVGKLFKKEKGKESAVASNVKKKKNHFKKQHPNAGDGTNSGISYNAAPLQYLAMEKKGQSPKQYTSQPSSIQCAYIIYIKIGE